MIIQLTVVPLVAELASEILRTRDRLRELDGRLEELVEADPGAEIVRSLPGMGLVLTAEFLAEAGDVSRFVSADRLAAAAGIVPALRASGGVSYQRRARRGNRVFKRIFYRSAFSAISCHEPSQAYYRRKRSEGKTAQQAVIALARHRVQRTLGDAKRWEYLRRQVCLGRLKKASGCTGPISEVLAQCIAYIPQIIAAILILVLATLLANFVAGIVRGATGSSVAGSVAQ